MLREGTEKAPKNNLEVPLTVKLVYKEQCDKCGPYTQVVFIRRFNIMEITHLGTCKISYIISRWSLKQISRYYK